ncbi:MAG: 1-deoxy-D-xylulose-5-phosphate synthase N-terminal domain-containing protein, partial [Sulfurovum sp.]|nr:1-deoxy-D-xylulose-5-phosphate synthase N-terminal domain-containing protein [Sulfurovum sp.]
MNIKNHSIEELEQVAQDIRQKILDTVSQNGGHLSSTMGATDIIIAMHKVFDVSSDPFIFDVSHQAYAHKLLTMVLDQHRALELLWRVAFHTQAFLRIDDDFVTVIVCVLLQVGVCLCPSFPSFISSAVMYFFFFFFLFFLFYFIFFLALYGMSISSIIIIILLFYSF